jgi:acyl-CoA synthetase (AMP-forming)/AMP-acid ligase II
MHAWIGFVFSCTMIVVAAAGKSGYHVIPGYIAGSATQEFLFLLGCACFGAVLSTLAPSYSPARIAALWSSSALGVVVVVLGLNSVGVPPAEIATRKPQEQAVEVEKAKKQPALNLVLKRTVHEGEWAPFEDFEERVRRLDAQQPPISENNEINHTVRQN